MRRSAIPGVLALLLSLLAHLGLLLLAAWWPWPQSLTHTPETQVIEVSLRRVIEQPPAPPSLPPAEEEPVSPDAVVESVAQALPAPVSVEPRDSQQETTDTPPEQASTRQADQPSPGDGLRIMSQGASLLRESTVYRPAGPLRSGSAARLPGSDSRIVEGLQLGQEYSAEDVVLGVISFFTGGAQFDPCSPPEHMLRSTRLEDVAEIVELRHRCRAAGRSLR